MKPERHPNLTASFAVTLFLAGGLGGYWMGHHVGVNERNRNLEAMVNQCQEDYQAAVNEAERMKAALDISMIEARADLIKAENKPGRWQIQWVSPNAYTYRILDGNDELDCPPPPPAERPEQDPQ